MSCLFATFHHEGDTSRPPRRTQAAIMPAVSDGPALARAHRAPKTHLENVDEEDYSGGHFRAGCAHGLLRRSRSTSGANLERNSVCREQRKQGADLRRPLRIALYE